MSSLFFSEMCAQTILLDEGFDGGTLPSGWSNIDNGSSPAGDIWEFDDPGGRNITAGNFSGNYAILDSDNYGSGNTQNASLQTLDFDTSSYDIVTLEYDYQYKDYQTPESCEVEVYNGSTWVTVASYTTGLGDNEPGSTKVSIDITTEVASASNAKVRFTYTGDWDWWWALDNIKVSGTGSVGGTSGVLGPGGIGATDGSSKLELWLRGDKDVTSDGSNVVTTWLDNSGNGNDVSLIGGDPTYTTDINNHEVISLDGNDYFQSSVSSNTGATASVYFAGTITGYSGSWAGIISGSKNSQLDYNTTDHVVFLNRNDNTDDIESHRVDAKSIVTDGLSGSGLKIMNSEYDGVNSTIRLDGVAGTSVSSTGNFNFDLIGIGKRITENKYTVGDYGEVIYFNDELTLVEKIIIENYLQAKYDGTLAANDFYDEDDNGDFDFDVAGIGQATDGSSHTDSQGTGIVRINNPRGLANDEFLFWGRNTNTAIAFETDESVYLERLNTTYRASRRKNPGSVDVIFDLSGVDLSKVPSCESIEMIIDNNDDFSSIWRTYSLEDIGGDLFRIEDINIRNNYYFTLQYKEKIVVDGTQFYNGSGSGNVPNTDDDCYKLLVKSTADGSLVLTENADVLEVEVESGGKLVISTGTRLQVTNGIDNSGDIRMIGTSQLIQTHTGESQNLSNTGDLYIDQQGTNDSKYRYNYWSSPVVPVGKEIYSVAEVLMDGSTPTGVNTSPSSINFISGYDGDYTTNPITISSVWLYEFDSSWGYLGENGTLSPGHGYSMKGPGAASSEGPFQGYTFVGVPNDGDYSFDVSNDDVLLLGNPYPSALDADAFIMYNSITNQFIDGSIYFWEHNGETSTDGNEGHYKSNYQGGYAVRNIGGGVAAVAPPGVAGLGSSSGVAPGQYIPVGQGFFVNAKTTDQIVIPPSSKIVFNNAMREFVEEGASSVFYKGGKSKKATEILEKEALPSIRIGFDQTNESDILLRRQLLVVFKDGLTNDYESGYDSSVYDLQNNDAYWSYSESNGKYVIAGLNSYQTNVKIPLAVEIGSEGLVYLSVLEKNGISDSIYLYDKLNDIYYEITDRKVSLYLEEGSYEDRFFISFKENSSLSIEDEFNMEDTILVYANSDKQLFVKMNSEVMIQNVSIYNTLGVLEDRFFISDTSKGDYIFDVVDFVPAIYVVKIETNKGIVTKKVFVK